LKILIVGSTSVIGRALAEFLTSQGVEVKLAGRRDADIFFDLSVLDAPPAINEQFDAVVHVAADFGGSTDQDYIRAEMVNASGTFSACSLAHSVKARHFVLLSSVFSTYSSRDPYYGIYALTKRHSEEAAQYYCAERGMDLTVLRPSQVYDDAALCRPHQEFLYMIADKAQAGQSVEVYGSHDALRNYIHLSDLTEIIKRVLQERVAGVFTCANTQSVKLSEMAGAAYRAFDTADKGNVVFWPDRQDLLDLPPIHDFDLYSRIQYQPRVGIEEGYRRIKLHRETYS
jgi:nucleoside-diphosphate-sugar epimerase